MFQEKIKKIKESDTMESIVVNLEALGDALYEGIEDNTQWSVEEIEEFAKDSTTAIADAAKRLSGKALSDEELVSCIDNCEKNILDHIKEVSER